MKAREKSFNVIISPKLHIDSQLNSTQWVKVLFDIVKNRKLSCVNTHFQYLLIGKTLPVPEPAGSDYFFFLIASTSMLGFEQYIERQYSQRI